MTATTEEKPSEKSEKVDLDNILIQIGQFGRYQLIQYILIAFILIFTAFSSLSFLFTAGNLEYRCHIPECEDINNTEYYPEWLNSAVPIKNSVPDLCTHFRVKQNITEEPYCKAENFDKDVKMTCDQFVYKGDENTILTEFGLHCRNNEWKLVLPGTINNFGQLFCFPMTGLLSDRFGRKKVLLWATLISGVLGIIRSFSVNYEMFLTFEFLDPLIGSGAYTTAFILGMELVGPDMRALGGTIACGFYAIGEALLGLIAMFINDWRWLLRALYIPFFICIAYFWWIPESVRWLMSKGRMNEAKEILILTAKVNRKPLSPETLDKFILDNPTHQDWKSEKMDLMYVIRTPHLRWRVINCSFCWLTNVFVFYGLSLNSVSLAGSKYLNFIAVSLVEIPGLFIAYCVMDRIGRKPSLCGSMIISAIACIASGLSPESISWLATTIFLIGKMSISVSFTVIYVYTAEMFPTNLRHSLLAICSAFGRIGSMASPQTPLLETLAGVVQISTSTDIKHEGITLNLEGSVNLCIGNKNVGIFEAFYNSVKPIQLLNHQIDLAPSGKISAGTHHEIPFEFLLICPKEPRILYETYHGVFVNVTYLLKCEIKRSFLAKSIHKTQEFIMQYKPTPKSQKSSSINFSLSPETLQKTSKERSIPRFLITGILERTECCVNQPITGSLIIHHTEVAIKSLEVQLVRVETCGCAEGYSRDATEIQNIQIADGNVCPKVQIPIYMILPRLFTCPTLITKNFKVEFELNLIVVFQDDHLVTENFQILLTRTN